MTDEELSELAECLEDACQARIAEGKRIGPTQMGDRMCPLGALLNSPLVPFPGAYRVEKETRIPCSVASGFINGFDGHQVYPGDNLAAFNLGRSFRERHYHS